MCFLQWVAPSWLSGGLGSSPFWSRNLKWLSVWIRQNDEKSIKLERTMSGRAAARIIEAVHLWAPPGDGKRELGGQGGKEFPQAQTPPSHRPLTPFPHATTLLG